jgi:hypothetical protein
VTANQQPRQILFSLRSIVLFSSAIAESGFVCGPVASVAPPDADRAEPVVTPAPLFAAAPEPDDWAVPALLVPGAVGSLAALPAPLGSLTELFGPPGLAGPGGTPLTAAVPAPAEPALGAAAPPLLCANETAGSVRIAIAASAAVTDVLVTGNSFII